MSKRNPTYQSQSFLGVVSFDPATKQVRVALNSPQLYQHFLKTVCKLGDVVSLYITSKRPKRSIAINRYYHLYLSLIALSSGHTIKELKFWVKGRFLTIGITEVFGVKTRITKSTADLHTGEFLELLDNIEFETGVPLPNTEPFNKALTPKEFEALKVNQKKIYQRLTTKIKGI